MSQLRRDKGLIKGNVAPVLNSSQLFLFSNWSVSERNLFVKRHTGCVEKIEVGQICVHEWGKKKYKKKEKVCVGGSRIKQGAPELHATRLRTAPCLAVSQQVWGMILSTMHA